jgi:hypothetical protein
MMRANKAPSYAVVAFGDMETASGVLKAAQVFDSLIEQRLWYIVRASRSVVVGATILLYQNGSGFRGTAVVKDVLEDSVAVLCGRRTVVPFSRRVVLDKCTIFAEPLSIRGLVSELTFVASKTYWGQSLRSTPRSISVADYRTILRHAKIAKDN